MDTLRDRVLAAYTQHLKNANWVPTDVYLGHAELLVAHAEGLMQRIPGTQRHRLQFGPPGSDTLTVHMVADANHLAVA